MMKGTGKKGNSKAVKEFIKENSGLFWYTKESEKENISNEFLVETILNWGDYKGVKKLIKLLGREKVAEIFLRDSQKQRQNYLTLVKHYFTLYFDDNAEKTAQ